MTTRNELLNILNASLLAERLDFARALAADWLAAWPGDLEIVSLLADIELREGFTSSASVRLEHLLNRNPEASAAYVLLAHAISQEDGEAARAKELHDIGMVLRDETIAPDEVDEWILHLQMLLHALRAEDSGTAIKLSGKLGNVPAAQPLSTVLHAQALLVGKREQDAMALATGALECWPDCIPFLLLAARARISEGAISQGVSYLHQAAALDPTGNMARVYLGADHPYKSLWPETLKADINRPIPAGVNAFLGGNQLSGFPASPSSDGEIETVLTEQDIPDVEVTEPPADHTVDGEPSTEQKQEECGLPVPEDWEAFQGPDAGEYDAPKSGFQKDGEELEATKQAFDKMASRLNATRYRKDIEARLPAYIVLTSRSRLSQSLGEEAFARVDEAVMDLVEAVRMRSGWSAYRLYIDDPTTTKPFDLAPVDPGNAWHIKLRLADLDKVLAKRGEMIGSLFILGSDEIIPFHHLPNPTDDDDDDIPSDNPYSTSDSNYLAPEWPVGRLPLISEEAICDALRAYTAFHRVRSTLRKPIARFRLWLRRRIHRAITNEVESLGYTASIWRKASLAVYKSIGETQSLSISPPVHAERLPHTFLHPVRFSYYNLHGLEDAPEWFGQRDPMNDVGQVDFPVALRPKDIVNHGRAPQVIFTEACYGANVVAKTAKSALSLTFLTSGTKAFVGSTKIAYGSVTTPLIAADLLGRLFWDQLRARTPVGEALRRAKWGLAAEMQRRQGFLDAEDQKTLISFQLYGDPLFEPEQKKDVPGAKVILRKTHRPTRMKTVNVLKSPVVSESDFDVEAVANVKTMLAAYLPSMSNATCTIRSHHAIQPASKEVMLEPLESVPVKRLSPTSSDAYVFTFSKSIQQEDRLHQHYARLTMDADGKVIKLAVSR